ncbi:MAG: aconitate hydratase AcnA [Planctomyces sp.]|nr:aconitate hydratase AcnA [Planctomyces sp.]MBA4119661.1 aconitate hydratase AcnA [Isosphaera sp.]
MTRVSDPFNARATLRLGGRSYTYFDLGALERQRVGRPISQLPFSVRVLLESLLRNVDGLVVTADDVAGLAGYDAKSPSKDEVPFMPGRVVLQDFTGVPCVVDLAAMRGAMRRLGGDPGAINPLVPCDLVIDHSVQVDAFASGVALTVNAQKEFERNGERYEFLKWGQQSLRNFRCVPPATGIVHQVNLEYLSPGVLRRVVGGHEEVYPDSCVGTDSHTTMINGLGVVGWGVGGIEAEAVMLGQAYSMLAPEVIGFRLVGRLPEGATATDLVLTVTQLLRARGVVDKFVEFFGPGIAAMSVPDRATIGNMAPEYGATIGFFPVDQKTIEYLRFTGRTEQAALTEAYARANHLWHDGATPEPVFTDVMELDLGSVRPSLAGPKRPQDRVELGSVKGEFVKSLTAPAGNAGFGIAPAHAAAAQGTVAHAAGSGFEGQTSRIGHGAVVIAAITSCTNTSNPDVMIAAGLVARKARALGLRRKPWVKTSLAPGSKVVTEYFDAAGLTADLEALGFHTVGYGCTTCIGNSGPLPDEVESAIRQGDLVVASVLSGNRNFEGRVHPSVKANYLASPPLVVAYAIAGSVGIDITSEPLGTGSHGRPVYLRDVWPTHAEVLALKAQCLRPEHFARQYGDVFTGNPTWNAVPVSQSELYPWNPASTYIQEPPYFEGMAARAPEGRLPSIAGARALAWVGDSVTTDHISPAGDIAEASPAGAYLKSLGVPRSQFNSYGSRRGNDRVMTRGTFANVRVKNRLAAGPDGAPREGWWTRDMSGLGDPAAVVPIFDAAQNYKKAGVPLIVLAGKDYGMGSSRDWAAKGTMLLGVRAVIAESFERIHRSNLVGMGVLPLTFGKGQSAASLGLRGDEVFAIDLPERLEPRGPIAVTAQRPGGAGVVFSVTCRLDSAVEIEYYRHGGILQTVLRRLLNESKAPRAVLV